MSLAYGMADILAYGTTNLGDEIKSKSKKSSAYQLIKALNPKERFIKESNPNLKKYQDDATAKEIQMEEGTEVKMLKIKVEKYADALVEGDMDMKQVIAEIEAMVEEPELRYTAVKWVQRTAKRRALGIGSAHWDVYSARTSRLQAHYLIKHFGDKDTIEQEIMRMRRGIGFRPARGLEAEIDKLLNNK